VKLVSAFVIAAIAVRPPDVTVERLYDELLAYHSERVHVPYRHEDEESRRERMHWIAEGVVAACRSEPLDETLGWTFNKCVALGTTAAKWESGLVLEVHSGARRGPSGERCLFQLHRLVSAVPDPRYRVTPEELAATTGLTPEATTRCAVAGVRTLAWHVHRCRFRADDYLSPAFIFAQYHMPSLRCRVIPTRMNSIRASSYRHLLTELERG